MLRTWAGGVLARSRGVSRFVCGDDGLGADAPRMCGGATAAGPGEKHPAQQTTVMMAPATVRSRERCWLARFTLRPAPRDSVGRKTTGAEESGGVKQWREVDARESTSAADTMSTAMNGRRRAGAERSASASSRLKSSWPKIGRAMPRGDLPEAGQIRPGPLRCEGLTHPSR